MNLIDILEEKAAPYIRMLRLKHQTIGTIAYLLGLLDANYFQLPTILYVFIGLATISMAGFMINDYFDAADTDIFSYRPRANTTNKVSGKVVLIIWAVFNLIGCLILANYGLALHAAILVIISTLYSLPPFRFKARFGLDIFTTLVQGSTVYSVGSALAGQGSIAALISLPFLTVCTFIGGAYFILLIMDYESDKKGNLKNTNVVLGYKWLIRISKLLLITSGLFFASLFYSHSNWWYYPLIIALPYFGYALGRLREGTESRKDLKSLMNISYTRGMTTMVLMTLYLILVVSYGLLRYYELIPKLPW